ncbi:lipocalin family protein [Niabella aquatica]
MKKAYLLTGAGLFIAAGTAAYFACRKTIPTGIKAINHFKKERFAGKWYEIARLDYRFEKNMSHVTAAYTPNEDGTIKVTNTGYNYKTYKQEQSIGKAKFAGNEEVAMLKVSFFGPFYAGYNVIAIDDNYQYALICGRSRDYLWLLSREKTMPETVKNEYLAIAEKAGFDISELVWTRQL